MLLSSIHSLNEDPSQLLHNSYGFSSLQTLFKCGLYLLECHQDTLGSVAVGEFLVFSFQMKCNYVKNSSEKSRSYTCVAVSFHSSILVLITQGILITELQSNLFKAGF